MSSTPKALIFRIKILCLGKNTVTLHTVWNKLQKKQRKNLDRNVEDLSDYRKEGTNRL